MPVDHEVRVVVSVGVDGRRGHGPWEGHQETRAEVEGIHVGCSGEEVPPQGLRGC